MRDHVGGPSTASGVGSRGFRRLTAVWSTSMVGDGVRIAALPLFAAVSTRDPLAVSAVAVAEVLPWLLVALPAGALVDRWQPRWVLVAAHGLRAVVTLLLAGAVATGVAGVWVLVVAAFVVTAAETFADPAAQRLLVQLAGPDDLEKGNGHFVSIETAALDVAGPLIAGALFLWQPAVCFALDGLSFLVAGLVAAGLPRSPRTWSPVSGLGGEVRDGVRYLFRQRGLRILVTAVLCAAVAVAAANAVMALYAVEVLGIAPAAVPTLWVAMGVGTLVAARMVPGPAARFGDGPVMVASMAVLAAGFLLLGAVSWSPIGWLAYVLVGLGSGGWNVLSATRRQRLTSAPMLGRVTNGYRVLTWGLMPIGAGLAGPVAELTSPSVVYLFAGGLLAVSLLLLARPLIRTGVRPASEVEHGKEAAT
ncbi:MFS transporter [Pseudonocardia spinosispora]|uniref:MFS transporter n=1 Tax=Pseudonocardia spinosispora TaxID=103441 RepID=UPI000410481C|nr:MFS transporter [Pseudonocardia spinosispora]